MTIHYLSTGDVADLLGIQSATVSGYIKKGMLPEPDVIVGSGRRAARGWTKERILAWHASRPRVHHEDTDERAPRH